MFPPEIINHIFSYCQGTTNVIMKEHIKCLDQVYQDVTHVYGVEFDGKSRHLPYILNLMGFYGQLIFHKDIFYSRYYSCVNCRRVGYAPPYIEFGEKFCNSYCAELFDY